MELKCGNRQPLKNMAHTLSLKNMGHTVVPSIGKAKLLFSFGNILFRCLKFIKC